jgi:hypothetical protein
VVGKGSFGSVRADQGALTNLLWRLKRQWHRWFPSRPCGGGGYLWRWRAGRGGSGRGGRAVIAGGPDHGRELRPHPGVVLLPFCCQIAERSGLLSVVAARTGEVRAGTL